jgi:acyl-CoA dehydrogenase
VRRLAQFLEAAAYFSPAHAYSLHVSFLGLFPILLGPNEALKREAVARLEGGGLFAFALSEKAHGSDLFSNEFSVRPSGPGRSVADGSKYYIGNANAACMVSILARRAAPGPGEARRSPFVFVAVRPGEAPAYGPARKIRTLGIRTAFVGEFDVRGHEFPESDVIASGRDAWDAAFATVDLGKFLLGFGAVGICERALDEAAAHLRARVLYGRRVIDLPHIRTTTAFAVARLLAMKLYATRALDYLQAAGPAERRYLLLHAVQKARVTTQAVQVLALLSECIGARGVESGTYFESALRDAQLIPGLEGSTHINHGTTMQFVGPYFAGSDATPPGHVRGDPGENPYWTTLPDRNARTVRFGPPLAAHEPLRHVANVAAFVRQVEAFRAFAEHPEAVRACAADPCVLLASGRCFTVVVFAQLVAEGLAAADADDALTSAVFHTLVEDLSAESLRLAAALAPGSPLRDRLAGIVRVPETTAPELECIVSLVDPGSAAA